MMLRSRILVLFALAAPTVALAAAGLRRPRHRPEPLPDPPVVLVPSPTQPISPPAGPTSSDDEHGEADALVAGNVVDLKGRAVRHARISLRDLEGVLVGAARADDDGHFEVHASTDGLVVLLAQAGERRGLAGPLEPARANEHALRIVVAPPARLRGVVVDGHGVPVE